MAYLVFDLAIILILVLFAWRGAARGLVLSLCGLVAVLVAFVGASFLAKTVSPMVAEALEPKFAAAIERQLEQQIHAAAQAGVATAQTPADLPLQDVLNVLRDMGFYEQLIDLVNHSVETGMLTVAASAAAAVAAAIAQSVAYLIIFIISFCLISLIWTILSHTLDLVTKLPGLHFLNKTGGAVIGLAKACIFLFVAAYLVQFSGNLIPEDVVLKTHLLKFFMTTNPMALLTGSLPAL